jgi:hypothetical protein
VRDNGHAIDEPRDGPDEHDPQLDPEEAPDATAESGAELSAEDVALASPSSAEDRAIASPSMAAHGIRELEPLHRSLISKFSLKIAEFFAVFFQNFAIFAIILLNFRQI